MNINKSKEELIQIMKDNAYAKSYAKRAYTYNSYKTYWAAWSALNEMYNRGDA